MTIHIIIHLIVQHVGLVPHHLYQRLLLRQVDLNGEASVLASLHLGVTDPAAHELRHKDLGVEGAL